MIDLRCPVHTLTLGDETFCLKKDDRTIGCAGRARARRAYSNLLLTLVIDMLSYFIVPFSGSERPRPQKELYKRTVECSVNGFTASFPEGMQIEGFHFLSPRKKIFFFLLASPKKQTNKQTNRKNVGRETATAVANYSGPGY